MDVQEFVQQTLMQIVNGVRGAQEELGNSSNGRTLKGPPKDGSTTGRVNPPYESVGGDLSKQSAFSEDGHLLQAVEFDMAVTVEEGASAKAGIKVLGLGGGSGDFAARTSSVSRVKFSVLVEMPRTP